MPQRKCAQTKRATLSGIEVWFSHYFISNKKNILPPNFGPKLRAHLPRCPNRIAKVRRRKCIRRSPQRVVCVCVCVIAQITRNKVRRYKCGAQTQMEAHFPRKSQNAQIIDESACPSHHRSLPRDFRTRILPLLRRM